MPNSYFSVYCISGAGGDFIGVLPKGSGTFACAFAFWFAWGYLWVKISMQPSPALIAQLLGRLLCTIDLQGVMTRKALYDRA